MKAKKIILFLSLAVILAGGLYAVIYAKLKLPPTFDGTQVDVEELYTDQSRKELKYVDGAASVIVQKNLAEAQAANDVASVVFDFRGYDTLGESFILLTAIAGSFVILARHNPSAAEGGTSPTKGRLEASAAEGGTSPTKGRLEASGEGAGLSDRPEGGKAKGKEEASHEV